VKLIITHPALMPNILRNISIRKDHSVKEREVRLCRICIPISKWVWFIYYLCNPLLPINRVILSPRPTPLPPSKVCALISQNDILVVFRDDVPS
jgi:hypothetical protein